MEQLYQIYMSCPQSCYRENSTDIVTTKDAFADALVVLGGECSYYFEQGVQSYYMETVNRGKIEVTVSYKDVCDDIENTTLTLVPVKVYT
jgi:hypothetical protein